MKIEILGSGGAVTTPKAFCNCDSCLQARKKQKYSRLGPSVFIHGPNILFDTPEEISIELNRSKITNIEACFYSHWHPDHTAGRRIFEMNRDWFHIPPKNKSTRIILTEKVAETFTNCMAIMNHFRFLEKDKLVDIKIIGNEETIEINGYKITPIQLGMEYVFGFIISNEGKKVLLIMDELKNWKPNDKIKNTLFDTIYLPFGIFDINPFTNERNIDQNHPILKEEQTILETIEIVNQLKTKNVILSHIEEPDNITIKLGKKLGKYYSNLCNKKFIIAYDTMIKNV